MSSQRSKPPRRRLRVEQIKDILVVSFVDRKILDEQNIQLIGEQLFSLVDEQGFEKLLLDFRNVEYKSSAAIGKLITLQKKLDRKHGRLIFYNLDPQIYEVYEITKFNRFFVIVNSLKDALALFDATAVLRVSCPVYNCRGCTNPLPPEALESSTLSLSCLACRTQFQVHATQTPESERTEAHVPLFQIPTYDQECIPALVGFPSINEVVGPLEPLACSALDGALLTVLPPPPNLFFRP